MVERVPRPVTVRLVTTEEAPDAKHGVTDRIRSCGTCSPATWTLSSLKWFRASACLSGEKDLGPSERLRAHVPYYGISFYRGTSIMQLIALIYKDQHVHSLQRLLAQWLETELSESSEDESNTSPQDQNGSCSSPVLTSNETDDSSDGNANGVPGEVTCKLSFKISCIDMQCIHRIVWEIVDSEHGFRHNVLACCLQISPQIFSPSEIVDSSCRCFFLTVVCFFD